MPASLNTNKKAASNSSYSSRSVCRHKVSTGQQAQGATTSRQQTLTRRNSSSHCTSRNSSQQAACRSLPLQSGETALIYAARQGHLPVVKHLVDCKANIEAHSKVSPARSVGPMAAAVAVLCCGPASSLLDQLHMSLLDALRALSTAVVLSTAVSCMWLVMKIQPTSLGQLSMAVAGA